MQPVTMLLQTGLNNILPPIQTCKVLKNVMREDNSLRLVSTKVIPLGYSNDLINAAYTRALIYLEECFTKHVGLFMYSNDVFQV